MPAKTTEPTVMEHVPNGRMAFHVSGDDLTWYDVLIGTIVFILLIGCGCWCLCAALQLNKDDHPTSKLDHEQKNKKSESRSDAGSEVEMGIKVEETVPTYLQKVAQSFVFAKFT